MKKLKTFKIYVVALFLFMEGMTTLCFCQTNFSAGLEAGINIPGFPQGERWQTDGTSNKEKTTPLISPIGGVWAKVDFRKHLFVSAGLQFYRAGLRYLRERDGYNTLAQTDFHSEERENFVFSRFSIPILFGYNLKIKKLPMSFFAGLRPLINLDGSYEYSINYTEDSGSGNIYSEKNINPFEHSALEIIAKKYQRQYFVGFSFDPFDRATISIFYAGFSSTFFQEHIPDWEWDATSYQHRYARPDLTLSLKYELFSISGTSN
jgi:hypothetical protein